LNKLYKQISAVVAMVTRNSLENMKNSWSAQTVKH